MQEIEIVSKCMNANDFTMAYTEGEHTVLQLMNEVKNINSKVAGTSGSHIAMCNEIRALMNAYSMPSLFLTINLADVYNPLVQLLAGKSINIDAWDQSILIAHNPVISTKFFDTMITTFIKSLLAHIGTGHWHMGIFGIIKAYYGCIEAQRQGTLHFHMLVWLEGALGPNALRD